MTLLVIDNSCLSHFARAGRLDLLDLITAAYDRSTAEEVMLELVEGVEDHPALGQLVGVGWLSIVELDLLETVHAAQIKAELGGDPTRDLGECAVIAIAAARGGVAVIDDQDAAAVGRRHGVVVVGTLAVVAAALKREAIDRKTAEALVDELVVTDMRLPVDGDGFVAWCYANSLLP